MRRGELPPTHTRIVKPYYESGGITIYHGDALSVTLGGDVLVSDPPYGMAYRSGWSDATVVNDDATTVRDMVLYRWAPRPALVFGRWSCPRPVGTRMVLTWDKGDWPGMGDLALPWGPSTEEIYVIGSGFVGKRSGSIVRDTKRPSGDTALHPTEKPVGLLEALIRRCPAGTVCDPFAGSGTTLVAAKNLGRRAIGIEIEERYCEIAARRLDQEVLAL